MPTLRMRKAFYASLEYLRHGTSTMGDLFATLHRWYRGTLYQAVVLGLISFTQPGIWDALNSEFELI